MYIFVLKRKVCKNNTFFFLVSECKAKWHQLRNAFLHALTRRNASKIFRRWKYENEMAFLVPFLSHGTWRGVLNRTGEEFDHDCSGSQYSDECSNQETMSGMSGIKRKVECEKDGIEEKRQCIEEDGEYLNNGNETQKTDYYKEIFQLVKEKIKSRKKKDEIDLLFESLAQAVKLLPKSEQVELKVGITSLVYEAQLKHGT